MPTYYRRQHSTNYTSSLSSVHTVYCIHCILYSVSCALYTNTGQCSLCTKLNILPTSETMASGAAPTGGDLSYLATALHCSHTLPFTALQCNTTLQCTTEVQCSAQCKVSQCQAGEGQTAACSLQPAGQNTRKLSSRLSRNLLNNALHNSALHGAELHST